MPSINGMEFEFTHKKEECLVVVQVPSKVLLRLPVSDYPKVKELAADYLHSEGMDVTYRTMMGSQLNFSLIKE